MSIIILGRQIKINIKGFVKIFEKYKSLTRVGSAKYKHAVILDICHQYIHSFAFHKILQV